MSETVAVNLEQHVVFRLGPEFYGIPVGQVREVVPVPNLTPVPRTVDEIEGIVNLRGNVVPVISLNRKLVLDEGEALGSQSRVVVVEWQSEVVGLLVDAVLAVLPLHPEPIEAYDGKQKEYVRGVAQLEDGQLVLLLDLLMLLQRNEG